LPTYAQNAVVAATILTTNLQADAAIAARHQNRCH
jgi:hypothetical protein